MYSCTNGVAEDVVETDRQQQANDCKYWERRPAANTAAHRWQHTALWSLCKRL